MNKEVVGYVCNNKRCRHFGTARYKEDGIKVVKECPTCKEQVKELLVVSRPGIEGDKISAPSVKLGNKKYYG